jgi:hypothetical protein
MSNSFVDSPMSAIFIKDNCDPPAGSTTNGEKAGAFSGYSRTSSPNAESEVSYDKMKGTPSGESDQF